MTLITRSSGPPGRKCFCSVSPVAWQAFGWVRAPRKMRARNSSLLTSPPNGHLMRVPEEGKRAVLLYSTNTIAAYQINEAYYGKMHYVWCNRYFDALGAPPLHPMPPSSTPKSLYWRLLRDLADYHSTAILNNRTGIKRGADAKLTAGVITVAERDEIWAAVDAMTPSDFRPVLYIIPHGVLGKAPKSVPPSLRAHPTSSEYIIEELPRTQFDIMCLEDANGP
jgi:hypothetical protein